MICCCARFKCLTYPAKKYQFFLTKTQVYKSLKKSIKKKVISILKKKPLTKGASNHLKEVQPNSKLVRSSPTKLFNNLGVRALLAKR